MTDKLISDLSSIGAAVADNTAFEAQRNGQTTTEQALGSDLKTYVKSWITKTDVGLSNVVNTDTTTQANVVFTALSAAAAAADADTFPVNQGAGNLKQTFTAVKTWVKSWIVKADVGLSNVANTKNNLAASTRPAASDDTGSGYSAGSLWLRTDTGDMWRCRDASAAAAKWVPIGITNHPGYVAGRRYLFAGQADGTSTGPTLTLNRIYLAPVQVPERITISTLIANVKTGVGASNAQLALYAVDPAQPNRPDALVCSTGSVATATSSTNVEPSLTGNTALEPGIYFAAVNTDTSGVAFGSEATSTNTSNVLLGADSLANVITAGTNSHRVGLYTASTYNTWPSSLHGATFVEEAGGGTRCPLMGFNVVSVP